MLGVPKLVTDMESVMEYMNDFQSGRIVQALQRDDSHSLRDCRTETPVSSPQIKTDPSSDGVCIYSCLYSGFQVNIHRKCINFGLTFTFFGNYYKNIIVRLKPVYKCVWGILETRLVFETRLLLEEIL